MASITKHKDILGVLAKASPPLAKSIIKTAPPSLIKTLSEIAFNCLSGNLRITPVSKHKLRKLKKNFRILASRNKSISTKKRTLQEGGFIGALAGLAIPILGELIPKIVKSIKNRRKKKK